MNGRVCIVIALLTSAALQGPAIGQTTAQGDKLLARADHKATIEGDLKGAIEEYRKIAAAAGADRQLAAEALVRMAECHQKLGDAEARAIYQRVVRDFGDQRGPAARARASLAALEGPRPSAPPGIVTRQVWTGPQVDSLGAVSPDGQSLSFVDWETGDLAVRSVATGDTRRLTNKGSWNDSTEFALFSRISPDGRLIAYNWMKANFGWEIRVAPLDGSSSHRVVFSSDANEDYAHPEAWSPDGRTLAVLRLTSDAHQLGLLPAAGGEFRVLNSFGPRPPGRALFSPDGRHLAYETPQSGGQPGRDIHAVAIQGAAETRLVEHPSDDYLLGWMADGRLLFASDRGGTIDAWMMPVRDGQAQGAPAIAKKDLGNVETIGLTRAGSLHYAVRATGPDVYRAAIDPQTQRIGSAARVPRRFIGTNVDPDWSPDGRRVAFVSERARPPGRIGAQVLCIVDVESGAQREFAVQGRLPRWSPDGKTILLRVSNAGDRGLIAVDAETGAVADVIKGEGVQVARWSRDGGSIYVLRTDYGKPGQKGQVSWVTVRDMRTGDETELFRHETPAPVGDMLVNDLSVSPDGSLLAFTMRRDRQKVIAVVPVRGGAPRDVFRTTPDFHVPNFASLAWTPDGREILFVRGAAAVPGGNTRMARSELWAVPVEGGQPRPLGLAAEGLSRVQIHSGTWQLLYQSGIRTAEIWVLENLK